MMRTGGGTSPDHETPGGTRLPGDSLAGAGRHRAIAMGKLLKNGMKDHFHASFVFTWSYLCEAGVFAIVQGETLRYKARKPRGQPTARRRRKGERQRITMTNTVIETSYRPSEDEPFMNERQREYFRRKLIQWKQDIIREAAATLSTLQNENENHPDIADRASSETDRAIELRARDRQRKLIAKIDAALARIEDGSYGYCEETGEPISLKRLEARPIATLSLEAQEAHERNERVHRDD